MQLKLQTPPEQLATPLAGAVHALPQLPQWLVLVLVLTHDELHLENPELQL